MFFLWFSCYVKMFIFLTVCCLFSFLYFSFGGRIGWSILRTKRNLRTASWQSRDRVHIGYEIELMDPILPLFFQTMFQNINPTFITAMSERWHEETNNIHLHIGEMIVTLDDVVCLHIPIEGKLMEYSDCGYELGIELMTTQLSVSSNEVAVETDAQWGGNVTIPSLQKLCERHLSRCK